jgi:hypothetical protein
MSDLPEEVLSPEWTKKESNVNRDKRHAVIAAGPSDALKRIKK